MTWTKSEIRKARKRALAPVLRARGCRLKPIACGNYQVLDHKNLIVKHSFWRWPSQDIDGNAIDYFMLVEGKSFNQAMQALTETPNT